MSWVQKRRAIIRGAECSDYALIPSSAWFFFLSSLFHCGCLSAQMLSAVYKTLQVRWREAQAWNLSGWKWAHRQKRSDTQKHSNPPGLQVEENQTTKTRGGRQRGGETKSRRLLFHSASPIVHISDSLCGLSFLVSDHPRRITAVKLLTSSSASVMTPHSAAKLPVYMCACERLSLRVFDVFIGLSHDLDLNQGYRKDEGGPSFLCFLCSSPLLPVMDPSTTVGGAAHVLMPSAVSGLLSPPFFPIQHLIPSSSPELLFSILITLRQHSRWTFHITTLSESALISAHFSSKLLDVLRFLAGVTDYTLSI